MCVMAVPTCELKIHVLEQSYPLASAAPTLHDMLKKATRRSTTASYEPPSAPTNSVLEAGAELDDLPAMAVATNAETNEPS